MVKCSKCGREVSNVCSLCWKCKDCKDEFCKDHMGRTINGIIGSQKEKIGK